jgi:methionyl-tRNA formyltransferase
MTRVRLVLLSMPCAEPVPVLAALLAAPEVEIVAVVLAGAAEGDAPVVREARQAGVPVIRAASLAVVRQALAAAHPDVAAAACFPWRLPPDVLSIPPLGVLNVHPSLLPLGRGPEPVFWTLRRGERETGVTVHLMDHGLDTGPVLGQERTIVPEGIAAPELELELMAAGGRLLASLLPRFARGEVAPRPQRHEMATAAPVPATADWLMPSTLPAGWAWQFARAVAPLGGPLAAVAGGRVIPVRDAVAHEPWQRPDATVIEHDDGTVTVRYSPGWVRFTRTDGA